MNAKKLVLPILSLAVITPRLNSQDNHFGQNLVRYDHCEWQIVHGPRVDIYSCPEEREIGELALIASEEAVDSLLRRFDLQRLNSRPQIHIFRDYHKFGQNHLGATSENLLGFTELFDLRIALPFLRNYEQYRHTIQHELAHYFHFKKITESNNAAKRDTTKINGKRITRYNRFKYPFHYPMWFVEGIAEYWSVGEDAWDKMFNRDAVFNNSFRSLREFSEQESFASYSLGGEFFRYLAATYGEDKIVLLYEHAPRYKNFFSLLVGVFGTNERNLWDGFINNRRREYYEVYKRFSTLSSENNQLSTGTSTGFNPAYYEENGEGFILFVTPEDGYEKIYRRKIKSSSPIMKPKNELILKAGDRTDFERLHFPYSRLSVSSKGRLAFVSKRLERDVIHVVDLSKENKNIFLTFDSLFTIRSPSWDPEGKRLVFSASDASGISDLYVVNVRDSSYSRITSDIYMDNDPSWSPDGKTIVFSSDRTFFGNNGSTNVFLINIETGEIRYLTYGPFHDETPRFRPDGKKIVFSSDRKLSPEDPEIYNLYEVDLEGNGRRITRYVSGALEPVYMDSLNIIFIGYENRSYSLHQEVLSDSVSEIEFIGLPDQMEAFNGWGWFNESERLLVENTPIENATPKYKISLISLNGLFGTGSGVTGLEFSAGLIARDQFNDRFILPSIQVRYYSDTDYKFLNSISGSIFYLDASRRKPFTFGVYHLTDLFFEPSWWHARHTLFQRNIGTAFEIDYPSSRFQRWEFKTDLRYSDIRQIDSISNTVDDPFVLPDPINLTRKGFVFGSSISFVKDNTLNLETGPISGMRFEFTIGGDLDIGHQRFENYSFEADVRKYFRMGLRAAYAIQTFGYWSNGPIPERIGIGGTTDFPLYPLKGFYTDRAWMVKQEVRFQFNSFTFIAGTPLGNIALPGFQGAAFLNMGQFGLGNIPGTVWGAAGLSFRLPIIPQITLRLDTGARFSLGESPGPGFRSWTTTLWFGPNF